MAIRVTRVKDLFTASVTPPHGRLGDWITSEPLEASALIRKLRDEVGCHTTDITDALYEADPLWLNQVKDG